MKAISIVAICLLCIVPALAAIQACNDETLARSHPSFQSNQKWHEMSDETEFRRFRLAHIASSVPSFDATSFSGRGVVMQITSANDITSAYAAITALRATGNTLPVQVYHANVMNEGTLYEFNALSGVSVHSIGEHASAIIESSFTEVLAISPRTFAVSDPASLFESAEYKSTGVIAFPSLYKTSPSNPIWSMLNKPCVDQQEQSHAAMVVNKASALKVLHVAEHLSGNFYSSMLNNRDNTMAFAAMSTATPISWAPASQAVGSSFNFESGRKYCAHSMMLKSMNGDNVFLVSANSEVVTSGSSVEAMNCFENVESVAHNDELVASIVRLQAAVPEHASQFVSMACPGDTMSVATWANLVGPAGPYYQYTYNPPSVAGTFQDYIFRRSAFYATNCGGFWSACAFDSGLTTTVVPTFVFNISARVGSNAHIRVSTPSTSTTYGNQWGNETYVRVIDNTGLRDECSAPFSGIFDSSIDHNIATNSYALVAVAWQITSATTGGKGCYKCTQANDLIVRITYTGLSSSALSTAIASVPMMVVAAIVAFMTQRFF